MGFIIASIVFLPIIYIILKRALSFFYWCWINGVDKKKNSICLLLWILASAICFAVVHYDMFNLLLYDASLYRGSLIRLTGLIYKIILICLFLNLHGVFAHTVLCFFPSRKSKKKV